MAVLPLVPLGPAGICRSRRRRSCAGPAALIPLVAEFARWLPRDGILGPHRGTMVLGRAGPAMGRLLFTDLILPVGREQILAVVGALIPRMAA
jgi:hypothetical protein